MQNDCEFGNGFGSFLKIMLVIILIIKCPYANIYGMKPQKDTM